VACYRIGSSTSVNSSNVCVYACLWEVTLQRLHVDVPSVTEVYGTQKIIIVMQYLIIVEL
jgi:hypothetical protein